MATVSVNATPAYQLQQTGTGILAGVNVSKTESLKAQFTNSGVTADSCDLLHIKTYSLVASTPQTIDLTALIDVFGNAVSFAKVRLFLIRINATTDAYTVLMGNAATNPWNAIVSGTATITIYPATANNDGYMTFTAPNTTGMPVSGGSKSIKFDPGANAVSFDLIIAGTSV
jgi:hypothetical protein